MSTMECWSEDNAVQCDPAFFALLEIARKCNEQAMNELDRMAREDPKQKNL